MTSTPTVPETGIDDAEVIRRVFLTTAGEPLLTPADPTEAGIRMVSFGRFLGLGPADTLTSPLVAHPLPFYPSEFPLGRKSWVGVNPAAMWHPLLWLHDRMASRHMLSFNGGKVVRPETDDEWSVRVMLECSTTRLYDETTGGWADVLALLGLDSQDPDVQARVQRWVDGGDDDVLDYADIAEVADDPDDPDWALSVVQSLIGDLYVISFTTIANSLVDATNAILEGAGGDDPVSSAKSIAMTAAHSFAKMRRSETQWWVQMAGRVEDDGDSRHVVEMRQRLETIRDHYLPMTRDLAGQADD